MAVFWLYAGPGVLVFLTLAGIALLTQSLEKERASIAEVTTAVRQLDKTTLRLIVA